MSKYTPWFPADVKPARVGVYQTGDPSDIEDQLYQHWNGRHWGMCADTIAEAKAVADDRSFFQNEPWRGLAKAPK